MSASALNLDQSKNLSFGKELSLLLFEHGSFFFLSTDHVEDPRGGFMSGGGWSGIKIFFVVLLVIVGLIVCGIVGYVIFSKDDPTRRKRFY